MNFVDWAGEVLRANSTRPFAHGFSERLGATRDVYMPVREPRSIAAPYYLTDLGVRRFQDPHLFLDLHLQIFQLPPLPNERQDRDCLLSSSIKDFGSLIDACILLTGNYKAVRDAIILRHTEVLECDNALTKIYSGVALAALSDPRCASFFEAVSVAVSTTPEVSFMAQHRLAAAQIKKFEHPESGLDILNRLDRRMQRVKTNGGITEGDYSSMRAVTSNLRALAHLKLGDAKASRREIEISRSLSTLDGLDRITKSESARYLAQENINLAQLLVQNGEENRAVEILETNRLFCETHCVEYLGEAVSALAYGYYLQGDYRKAIETSLAAIEIVALEASPTRLRVSREILVGSFAEVGEIESAIYYLQQMDEDPLGLTVQSTSQSKLEKSN